MSAGLMLVHTLRRWPLTDVNDGTNLDASKQPVFKNINPAMSSPTDQSSGLFSSINFVTTTGTEQILVIGFVCVLTIKYIFFENKDMYNMDMTQNSKYSRIFEDKESNQQLDSSKDLLVKDDNQSSSGVSESCSNSSPSTPSSTRPTTPTTSSMNGDDMDNSSGHEKPATPSILITTQDSDTESVIAEYRRKISESGSMFV